MATTSTPLWKESAMRILESARWPMTNFPAAKSTVKQVAIKATCWPCLSLSVGWFPASIFSAETRLFTH